MLVPRDTTARCPEPSAVWTAEHAEPLPLVSQILNAPQPLALVQRTSTLSAVEPPYAALCATSVTMSGRVSSALLRPSKVPAEPPQPEPAKSSQAGTHASECSLDIVHLSMIAELYTRPVRPRMSSSSLRPQVRDRRKRGAAASAVTGTSGPCHAIVTRW